VVERLAGEVRAKVVQQERRDGSEQSGRLEVARTPKQGDVQFLQVSAVVGAVEAGHIRHQSEGSPEEGTGQQAPETCQPLTGDHDPFGPPSRLEVNQGREDVLHSLRIIGAVVSGEEGPVHFP